MYHSECLFITKLMIRYCYFINYCSKNLNYPFTPTTNCSPPPFALHSTPPTSSNLPDPSDYSDDSDGSDDSAPSLCVPFRRRRPLCPLPSVSSPSVPSPSLSVSPCPLCEALKTLCLPSSATLSPQAPSVSSPERQLVLRALSFPLCALSSPLGDLSVPPCHLCEAFVERGFAIPLHGV